MIDAAPLKRSEYEIAIFQALIFQLIELSPPPCHTIS